MERKKNTDITGAGPLTFSTKYKIVEFQIEIEHEEMEKHLIFKAQIEISFSLFIALLLRVYLLLHSHTFLYPLSTKFSISNPLNLFCMV